MIKYISEVRKMVSAEVGSSSPLEEQLPDLVAWADGKDQR